MSYIDGKTLRGVSGRNWLNQCPKRRKKEIERAKKKRESERKRLGFYEINKCLSLRIIGPMTLIVDLFFSFYNFNHPHAVLAILLTRNKTTGKQLIINLFSLYLVM